MVNVGEKESSFVATIVQVCNTFTYKYTVLQNGRSTFSENFRISSYLGEEK